MARSSSTSPAGDTHADKNQSAARIPSGSQNADLAPQAKRHFPAERYDGDLVPLIHGAGWRRTSRQSTLQPPPARRGRHVGGQPLHKIGPTHRFTGKPIAPASRGRDRFVHQVSSKNWRGCACRRRRSRASSAPGPSSGRIRPWRHRPGHRPCGNSQARLHPGSVRSLPPTAPAVPQAGEVDRIGLFGCFREAAQLAAGTRTTFCAQRASSPGNHS